MTTVSVAALLHTSPLARTDARALLAHALGWSRAQLITRANESLDAAAVARYRTLETRRSAGEPIAQLVGTREFFGLEFDITPAILIPRPETEHLVTAALDTLTSSKRAPRVLDLGTGSGAIAVALATARPDARIWALDRSAAALAVARHNASKLLDPARPGGALHFLRSDWYKALDPALKFTAIISNPPYIANHDPHLEQGDLRFEPRDALTDGADGLTALRQIIASAPAFLLPSGTLWVEHGYEQAAAVRTLFTQRGFVAVTSLTDLAGIERVTGGCIPD